MNIEDLKYLACALDTEGTLLIHIASTRENYLAVRMRFTNTSKDWLKYLNKLMGGEDKIKLTSNSGFKTNRPLYFLNCQQDTIRSILPQIYPYLIIKKETATLVLEFLKLRNRRHHSRLPYPPRIYEIYEEYRGLDFHNKEIRRVQ